MYNGLGLQIDGVCSQALGRFRCSDDCDAEEFQLPTGLHLSMTVCQQAALSIRQGILRTLDPIKSQTDLSSPQQTALSHRLLLVLQMTMLSDNSSGQQLITCFHLQRGDWHLQGDDWRLQRGSFWATKTRCSR